MELATVTSKGQITIPSNIRAKLRLKPGDKVLFIEEHGVVTVRNSSMVALSTIQDKMAGDAERTGMTSAEDVVHLVKEVRHRQ
ncbi:MAG: AbrB/MazE/SpoVT family DNA-binding domain-containing protein [Alkalispirochaeta sp.]